VRGTTAATALVMTSLLLPRQRPMKMILTMESLAVGGDGEFGVYIQPPVERGDADTDRASSNSFIPSKKNLKIVTYIYTRIIFRTTF
jgi:hypothetical protein